MTTQRYLQRLGLEPLREGLEGGFKRNIDESDKTPPPTNRTENKCKVIQLPIKNKQMISETIRREGVQ